MVAVLAGPTLTNILFSLRRVLGQQARPPPKPKFEVLFLDEELRIHRTGEGNIFVQGRPAWLRSVGEL